MTSRPSTASEQNRRDWTIRFGIALLTSLIVSLLGPFSTYERFSFLERLVYWGGMTFCLIVPAVAVRAFVLRVMDGSPLVLDAVAAVAISLTIAPPIWAFNLFVMDFDVHRPMALAEHFAIGLLICFIPVVVRAYMRETQADATPDAVPATAQDPDLTGEDASPFLRRLDPDKCGEVWRVSADNHQVAVFTSMGESRVRLRFSDAVQELDGMAGSVVHRSHWVAYSAIREVVQDGRKHKIILHCGTEIPVSQAHADALREAGFLREGAPD